LELLTGDVVLILLKKKQELRVFSKGLDKHSFKPLILVADVDEQLRGRLRYYFRADIL
jgi:hypothetical protein